MAGWCSIPRPTVGARASSRPDLEHSGSPGDYTRGIDEHSFTFGLPPSLGQAPVWELAREFADVLYAARFATIVPFKSYEALQHALFASEVDAAWGPPLICARVEAAGGTVALRGVRQGAVTYRSVLLSRALDQFDLSMVGLGAFRPRAVWVDEWSMAGYVLPKAHLRALGIDASSMLLTERTLGSYTACFDALLGWDADLTASFIGGEGLEAAWGTSMRRFRQLGVTDETPNDGIVLGPNLSPARVEALLHNLHNLLANEHSHRLLATAFSVDDFDRPPAQTYAPLLALLAP